MKTKKLNCITLETLRHLLWGHVRYVQWVRVTDTSPDFYTKAFTSIFNMRSVTKTWLKYRSMVDRKLGDNWEMGGQ